MRHLLAAICLLLVAAGASAIDTLCVSTVHVPSPATVAVAAPSGQAPPGGWPSLYLLHGHNGSWANWPRQANLDSIASALGMVIVCPDGHNSWYIDAPSGRSPRSAMESYITLDLIPLVDSLYHTSAAPSRRAIAGLSMGGYGAMWLGARHPSLFGAIGSMSGALDLDSRSVRDKFGLPALLGRYADDPQAWHVHSPVTLVPALAASGQRIIIECGTGDFFFADNERFHRLLREAGVDHTFITRPGIHNWAFWRGALTSFLRHFPSDNAPKP